MREQKWVVLFFLQVYMTVYSTIQSMPSKVFMVFSLLRSRPHLVSSISYLRKEISQSSWLL